jgi:hypothetical protein
MVEPVPTKPTRQANFTYREQVFPNDPLPGSKVDQEFDRTNNSLKDTIDFVRQAIADDGSIKPAAVPSVQGPIGPTGLTGPDGPQGPTGQSYQPDAIGPTGDRAAHDAQTTGFSFLDTTLGVLYFKNSATSADWSDGFPFTIGQTGPAGPRGTRVFYVATGVPDDADGLSGDLAFVEDGGLYFEKLTESWVYRGSFLGPQGPVGPIGPQGPQGPTGPVGPQGPQGPQGVQGALGATGPTGPVGPSGAVSPGQDQTTWNAGASTTESSITPAKLHAKFAHVLSGQEGQPRISKPALLTEAELPVLLVAAADTYTISLGRTIAPTSSSVTTTNSSSPGALAYTLTNTLYTGAARFVFQQQNYGHESATGGGAGHTVYKNGVQIGTGTTGNTQDVSATKTWTYDTTIAPGDVITFHQWETGNGSSVRMNMPSMRADNRYTEFSVLGKQVP